MAAPYTRYEKTPEQTADEQIRIARRLQQEQDRVNKVAERTKYRDQALKAGLPQNLLPDPSQIATMSDKDWTNHTDRMSRMGFNGVDGSGKLLPPPAQSPLVPTTAAPRAATPLAGLNGFDRSQIPAALPEFNSTASVALPVAPSSKDVAPATPAPARPTVAPLPQQFETTPADARGIAARYGAPGTVARTTYGGGPRTPFIAGADGKNVAPEIARRTGELDPTSSAYDPNLRLAAFPKKSAPAAAPVVAPVIPGPAPIASPVYPSVPLSGIGSAPTADLNAPAKQTFGGKPVDLSLTSDAPAIATPPSSATLAGRAVTATLAPNAPDASAFPPRIPGTRGESALQPMAGDALVQTVKDFAGGLVDGKSTAAGVSNSQAAGFTQPTKDNPVPVTPTSPNKLVDTSANSIARFGQDDEDWKNKQQFAGF